MLRHSVEQDLCRAGVGAARACSLPLELRRVTQRLRRLGVRKGIRNRPSGRQIVVGRGPGGGFLVGSRADEHGGPGAARGHILPNVHNLICWNFLRRRFKFTLLPSLVPPGDVSALQLTPMDRIPTDDAEAPSVMVVGDGVPSDDI